MSPAEVTELAREQVRTILILSALVIVLELTEAVRDYRAGNVVVAGISIAVVVAMVVQLARAWKNYRKLQVTL